MVTIHTYIDLTFMTEGEATGLFLKPLTISTAEPIYPLTETGHKHDYVFG